MTRQGVRAARLLRGIRILAGLIALPGFSATVSAQQFYAEQQADGGLRVVDGNGAEVSVVNGDPVGTRPDYCPPDSYYFSEMDSDRTLLVLSDCTNAEEFPVELLSGAE